MKDLTRKKEVAKIKFDLRTIYFNHCLKRPAVSGNVGPLPEEETIFMREDTDHEYSFSSQERIMYAQTEKPHSKTMTSGFKNRSKGSTII